MEWNEGDKFHLQGRNVAAINQESRRPICLIPLIIPSSSRTSALTASIPFFLPAHILTFNGIWKHGNLQYTPPTHRMDSGVITAGLVPGSNQLGALRWKSEGGLGAVVKDDNSQVLWQRRLAPLAMYARCESSVCMSYSPVDPAAAGY